MIDSSKPRRFPLIRSLGILLSLATITSVAASKDHLAAAPLPYDPSAYEIAPQFAGGRLPWKTGDLRSYLLKRVAAEKQRRELDVYYYRIGYTMAFPLPVGTRPTREQMPSGVIKSQYPWLIWLAWDLEERWRILHLGWRQFGDEQAGRILQRELAALARWDRFVELNENVGLVTGHFAAVLSIALADSSDWNASDLREAKRAAEALIERDVWPWFEKNWQVEQWTPARLGNIPLIALVRSAQLARVIGSPRRDALDERSREALRVWSKFRLDKERHSEGVAYDGYLMDSMTEWMAGLPDRKELLKEHQDAFRDLAVHAMQLTLPGRLDLQAPVGDVEPEMTYWATVLTRLAAWYQWEDVAWMMQRFALNRMRVPALAAAFQERKFFGRRFKQPVAAPREHQNALALRTGWECDDVLAAVGLSRGKMGHLHNDAGHVTIGWMGRFWILDPGYQQYRPGDERDYTLGAQAHNIPVIGGTPQSARAPKLRRFRTATNGWQHTTIDLTECYKGMPNGAGVLRDVWLVGTNAVVVRDNFKSLAKNVEITTSWHAGTHLAWAFKDGWTRLSDGRRALWCGTSPGALTAPMLMRHSGTRGPLTLTHGSRLAEGDGVRWWIFCFDPSGGWRPPGLQAASEKLTVELPGGPAIVE